jgi:prepilin-type N-terminal cleavage/methylation domain-containing protein
MKQRAFTMMELMVTLAIAGIIAAAAVSFFALLARTFADAQRLSLLTDRSANLSSYLGTELSAVGGNGASAAQAVFVDHNCGADGDYPACFGQSDRIRLFSAVSNTPSCVITQAHEVGSDYASGWRLEMRKPTGDCCMNDLRNGVDQTGAKTQFLRRHALITSEKLTTAVMLTADPAHSNEFRPGGSSTQSNCVFRAVPAIRESESHLVGGGVITAAKMVASKANIAIADHRVLFIDQGASSSSAGPVLKLHVERDENFGMTAPTTVYKGVLADVGWGAETPAADETQTVAEGVYDMHVDFGYDLDDNGVLAGSEHGPNKRDNDGRFLRTLRIDLAVGVRNAKANTLRFPLYPGGTLSEPGTLLRAISVEVVPRNANRLEDEDTSTDSSGDIE